MNLKEIKEVKYNDVVQNMKKYNAEFLGERCGDSIGFNASFKNDLVTIQLFPDNYCIIDWEDLNYNGESLLLAFNEINGNKQTVKYTEKDKIFFVSFYNFETKKHDEPEWISYEDIKDLELEASYLKFPDNFDYENIEDIIKAIELEFNTYVDNEIQFYILHKVKD